MEVYTAHHSETVDQLLEWPWRRFERFYDSFQRRRLAEQLEVRKNAMIAALWSNSNYDDDKGTRRNAITEIEDSYDEAVEQVLDPDWERKKAKADKEWEENPFFQPVHRMRERLEKIEHDGTVADVVGPDVEIDQ